MRNNRLLLSFVIACILIITATKSYSQTDSKQTEVTPNQYVVNVAYRIYPTTNIWNLIKLNTRNGLLWQVQHGNEEDRITVVLNSTPLVAPDKETNDRFGLYATKNIYTFILLDQVDGRTWQVQWGTSSDKRGMVRIY